MSYSFTINFAHCEDVGAAFLLAHKAAELAYKNLAWILEDERYFIPGLRKAPDEWLSDEARAENEHWLFRLLNMRFVWWPEYELLALSGEGWSDDVENLFARQVYFQNSCDQDYEFTDWDGLGQPFDNIVRVCRNGSVEDMLKMLNLGREDHPWQLDGDEDEAYLRRSAAYNAIYETLKLDRWLWGQDDDAFIRFAISPLNSQERIFDAKMSILGFCKRLRDEEDRKKGGEK